MRSDVGSDRERSPDRSWAFSSTLTLLSPAEELRGLARERVPVNLLGQCDRQGGEESDGEKGRPNGEQTAPHARTP